MHIVDLRKINKSYFNFIRIWKSSEIKFLDGLYSERQ